MVSTILPPFHLALLVHDIDAARHFYGEVLASTAAARMTLD